MDCPGYQANVISKKEGFRGKVGTFYKVSHCNHKKKEEEKKPGSVFNIAHLDKQLQADLSGKANLACWCHFPEHRGKRCSLVDRRKSWIEKSAVSSAS